MSKKGFLCVLSGASGAGKGTVLAEYLKKYTDLNLSVSVTTRDPRPGEQEGIHYFFRTREQVEAMIEAGELLEHATYCGNLYGTPDKAVEERLSAGQNVVLEIDIQGALQVMKLRENCVSVFIMPPSLEVLEKRLRGRGTESEEVIRDRLAVAEKEMAQAHLYDHVVINGVLEDAVAQLHEIIQGEIKKRNI